MEGRGTGRKLQYEQKIGRVQRENKKRGLKKRKNGEEEKLGSGWRNQHSKGLESSV